MACAVAISAAGSGRRRWGVAAGASGTTFKPLVKGPPPQYDHRVLQQRSRELVGRQHPELLPLVEQGGCPPAASSCRCHPGSFATSALHTRA